MSFPFAVRVFLAGVVFAVGCGFVALHCQSVKTAERRKRDADALAIRDGIVIFAREHENSLPSSLSELTLRDPGVDPSPFRLLRPGHKIRNGETDVVAQAEQAGNGKHTISIYADGSIRWR